jgi:hypothetical protein
MGRSFWIMDDIAPLRQLAASVTRPTRTRPTDNPDAAGRQAARDGDARQSGTPRRADVVRVSQENVSGLEQRTAPARPAAGARAPIKPFDGSNVFLFAPAPAYRVHYQPSMGRPDAPEYPPAGARIDYYLATPPGEVKLEIVDATGKIVRSYSSATSAAPQGGRGGGRRGGGLPSTLPAKVGMNRFVWDLRYAGGPSGGGDGEGGGFAGQGPLVAPGTFKARLTAGGTTRTEPFTVKIDPRIAKDGITALDLAEQTRFALKVRDALAEARQLAQRVRRAVEEKRGDAGRLQAVLDRLNTKPGPYEDQMFIDQMSNVGREIGGADQKVGASAYDRFNQLMKEWESIKADADAAMR